MSTVARRAATAASVCDMNLCRHRRRLPREHDLGTAAWRGDNGQRGADAIGALLHARHPETRPGPALSDALAVISHRQAQTDGTDSRSPDRDASRAGMPDGVGQRLLRDADDFALDAVPKARQLAHDDVDRHIGCALSHLRETLESRRDVLAGADV